MPSPADSISYFTIERSSDCITVLKDFHVPPDTFTPVTIEVNFRGVFVSPGQIAIADTEGEGPATFIVQSVNPGVSITCTWQSVDGDVPAGTTIHATSNISVMRFVGMVGSPRDASLPYEFDDADTPSPTMYYRVTGYTVNGLVIPYNVVHLTSSPGTPQWVKLIGGPTADGVNSVVVDSSGSIYIVGNFTGTINPGLGDLTSVGGQNILLAKYDSSGALLWAERLGLGGEAAPSMCLDRSGNILIAGNCGNGITDVSGATAPGGANQLTGSTFIAKYTNAGVYLWGRAFAGSTIGSVVVDSANNVICTGNFNAAIDLGNGIIFPLGDDVFVAKYSSFSGGYMWAITGQASATSYCGALSIDSADNVVFGLRFRGTVNLGDGVATSSSGTSFNIYIIKLRSSDGSALWSRLYGLPSYAAIITGIAIDSSRSIYATGFFFYQIDLGTGVVTNLVSPGYCPFLAKYLSDGTPQWVRVFSGGFSPQGESVAVDNNGNVYASGHFLLTLYPQGGPPLSPTGTSANTGYIIKYNSDGVYQSAKAFGPLDRDNVTIVPGLAQDGAYTVVGGATVGTTNFGIATLTPAGGYDGYLMRISV